MPGEGHTNSNVGKRVRAECQAGTMQDGTIVKEEDGVCWIKWDNGVVLGTTLSSKIHKILQGGNMHTVILLDLKSDDVGIRDMWLYDSYEVASQAADNLCNYLGLKRGVEVQVASVKDCR